jgi:hypothetical protein
MAKRIPDEEHWQAQKEERVQRARARKYRARVLRVIERKPDRAQAGQPDLHGIIAKVHSTDEATRAQAVRSLCPCRIGWDGFQQGIDVVARMQKDRSPEVRRQALHVFEDAYGMQAMENRKAEREVDEAGRSDAAERARQVGRHAKREMTAAFGRRRRQ